MSIVDQIIEGSKHYTRTRIFNLVGGYTVEVPINNIHDDYHGVYVFAVYCEDTKQLFFKSTLGRAKFFQKKIGGIVVQVETLPPNSP